MSFHTTLQTTILLIYDRLSKKHTVQLCGCAALSQMMSCWLFYATLSYHTQNQPDFWWHILAILVLLKRANMVCHRKTTFWWKVYSLLVNNLTGLLATGNVPFQRKYDDATYVNCKILLTYWNILSAIAKMNQISIKEASQKLIKQDDNSFENPLISSI